MDEAQRIPEFGRRDLGITYPEIKRGLHYNKTTRPGWHPSVEKLWEHGVEPEHLPPGTMMMAIWPLPSQIIGMRDWLSECGLTLSVRVEDNDAKTYMLRGRYRFTYGNFDQAVTCEGVIIVFPITQRAKLLQFKMRFGRRDAFDNFRPGATG